MVYLEDIGMSLDGYLIQRLENGIKKINKTNQDFFIILTGGTGTGKTNLAVGIMKYISHRLNRSFNLDNVFFDAEEMIKFAVSTQDQMILWDEAATAGLASEWQKNVQRQLVKLAFMARKKRHVYVICIPKFEKLNEVLVDKANCMLRTYESKGNPGHFQYFTKVKLKQLYDNWKRTKIVKYTKFKRFFGNFGEYLPKFLNEEEYNKKKDVAILGILDDPKKKANKSEERIVLATSKLRTEGKTMKEIAQIFEVTPDAIYDIINKYQTRNKTIVLPSIGR